jgi:hypothetical protein
MNIQKTSWKKPSCAMVWRKRIFTQGTPDKDAATGSVAK